ncbi:MAG: nitronate monooxygenase [Marinilabiliales bacterium]|nr:nitronate monooxygenase [Marinilabiliales bacterium]
MYGEKHGTSSSSFVEETVMMLRPFEQTYGKAIPVIAGGGLYTGKDIYEILKAGATAAKLGSRFVTTHGVHDASIEYKKQSYLAAAKEDIVIIDSPVGLPGRVVHNEFVQQIMDGEAKPFECLMEMSILLLDYRKAPFCIAKGIVQFCQGKYGGRIHGFCWFQCLYGNRNQLCFRCNKRGSNRL